MIAMQKESTHILKTVGPVQWFGPELMLPFTERSLSLWKFTEASALETLLLSMARSNLEKRPF